MSLRARLIAGMALIALVLASTAVFVTRTTERQLVDQVDELLQAAGPLGSPPRRDGDRQRGFSSVYAAFVSSDGTFQVLSEPDLYGDESSPDFGDVDVTEIAATLRSGRLARFDVPDLDGDGRYRVAVRGEPRIDGAFVIATSLDDVDDTMGQLGRMILFATVATLAVLALVTWWVVHLGVRPIKRMTGTARAIADGDLSQRVEVATTGTEAAELGDALNTMMGRIETAFAERARSEDKLRQFVADASHELRTPVQTIRGYSELYRMGALAQSGQLDDAMRRTESEALRMGSIVEDLLLLARVDQGRPLERQPVDLAVLARDAGLDATARDPQRTITVDAGSAVEVIGDEHRLRQVVSNLVSNAMVHTPASSAIRIRARLDGSFGVLEVSDEGPGLSAEQLELAFERFWRADPARARHRGGSGLGLSIVQSVTDAHGGSVEMRSTPADGTTVTVSLPVAGPDDSDDPDVAAASDAGGFPPPSPR